MQRKRTDPHDNWHVAVLRDDGRVFAPTADGSRDAKLPVVRVPRGTRVVPHVVSALANDYGLDVFCLTDLNGCRDDRSAARTMLAELCGQPPVLPSQARWMDPAELYISSDNEREQPLSAIVDACARTGHDTARAGFWDRLRHWVDSVLASADGRPHAVSGTKTQWNAGHGFSLVRLETSGPAVWFKSTGSPNESECRITARIAERHPRYSPRLLASHDTWRGWLTEEVGGPSLRHASTDAWTRAAADVARIQIDECDRGGDWLLSGCDDLRVKTLAPKIDEFFDGMTAIFERQVTPSPARLVRAELETTADALRRAFDTTACLPDTLVHADLNPDNIFFRDARAVFLDWAAAYVGTPFTAIENLCGHFRRSGTADRLANEPKEPDLREAYCDVWRDTYGAALVSKAMSVAPMVRYACLAMRSAGWLWQAATPPTREPFLRSLTRSMHHSTLAPGN